MIQAIFHWTRIGTGLFVVLLLGWPLADAKVTKITSKTKTAATKTSKQYVSYIDAMMQLGRLQRQLDQSTYQNNPEYQRLITELPKLLQNPTHPLGQGPFSLGKTTVVWYPSADSFRDKYANKLHDYVTQLHQLHSQRKLSGISKKELDEYETMVKRFGTTEAEMTQLINQQLGFLLDKAIELQHISLNQMSEAQRQAVFQQIRMIQQQANQMSPPIVALTKRDLMAETPMDVCQYKPRNDLQVQVGDEFNHDLDELNNQYRGLPK